MSVAAVTTCRGCGATIKWVKMSSGKAMPVDLPMAETLLTPMGAGPRQAVVTPDGVMVTGFSADRIIPGAFSVSGYRPHWASCPRRADFKEGT